MKDISQVMSVTRTIARHPPLDRVRYPILDPSATRKASANDWNIGLSICAVSC